MTPRHWLILSVVLLAGAAPVAQQGQGTGVLRGQVVSHGSDPKPVRRAIVTVSGDGLPVGRTTITDDQGAFVVAGLPAGRLMVTATKPAHLPSAYGAHQPGRAGVAIHLEAGQTRDDVTLSMAKAGVIAGTLRSALGEPVANVDVAAFRVPQAGQNVHLEPAGSAVTDDRGMYRIFDLPPGEYVIAGVVRRRLVGNGDAEAVSTANMEARLRALERKSAVIVPPVNEGRYNWAPVYFPGSPSPQQAVPVRLKIAEEREGVDFVVAMTRMATVEGVLIGEPAAVSAAQFFFNASGMRLQPLLGVTPQFSTRVTPAGRVFTYTGVPPGLFSVTAHVPGESSQWARLDFQVTGEDVPDLAMSLQPAVRIAGRVVFEGLEAPPAGALRGATIRPVPTNGIGQSASGSTRMGNPFIPAVPLSEQGAFEIRGVVPTAVALTLTSPNATGWTPRSILVNGRDVLDEPLDVRGDLSDVVVTMTNRPTRLSGRIITPAGAPGSSLFIAVFPQDKSLWRPGARRIVSARADTAGRWSVEGLPPGDYFLVALTDLVSGELNDQDFLAQLIAGALPLPLAAGEQKVQDLQIGK